MDGLGNYNIINKMMNTGTGGIEDNRSPRLAGLQFMGNNKETVGPIRTSDGKWNIAGYPTYHESTSGDRFAGMHEAGVDLVSPSAINMAKENSFKIDEYQLGEEGFSDSQIKSFRDRIKIVGDADYYAIPDEIDMGSYKDKLESSMVSNSSAVATIDVPEGGLSRLHNFIMRKPRNPSNENYVNTHEFNHGLQSTGPIFKDADKLYDSSTAKYNKQGHEGQAYAGGNSAKWTKDLTSSKSKYGIHPLITTRSNGEINANEGVKYYNGLKDIGAINNEERKLAIKNLKNEAKRLRELSSNDQIFNDFIKTQSYGK